MVGNTDDHRILQLALGFQLRHKTGEQVIHQLRLQIGAVGLLIAGQALEFRVFLQAPVAEDLVILVAQVGGTGDNKVQTLAFPEEFLLQAFVVKQELVIIQQLLGIVRGNALQVVRVADIILIAHGFREDTTAVKIGAVVMEGLGGIALPAQQ